MVIIKGRFVKLRRLKSADLTHVIRWHQDKELMRYYDRLPVHGSHELEQEFKNYLNLKSRLDFLVETQNGTPIGLVYLKKIHWKDRNCELHVIIGEAQYKKFLYGCEAELLLLRYAFENLNMHKVYGRAMEFATEAIRLIKAAGFVEEAVLRNRVYQGGRFWDVLIFGLLNREFDGFVASAWGKRLCKLFHFSNRTCCE